MDAAVFCEGGLIPDAVERCFERICEAAKKLGSLAEELCPGIRWHGIRGFGNFLRHEYDGIELELLWVMVQRDLPPLRTAVEIGACQAARRLALRGGRRICRRV